LRKAEGVGRPLGTADFVIELERRLGRPIARRGPRAEGNGDPRRRAVEFAAIGKLYCIAPRLAGTNETLQARPNGVDFGHRKYRC
jgi:hypothetical protein